MKAIKNMIIHPICFAIFPVLFLYSHNIEQVAFLDVLLSLIIIIGFAVLLNLILYFFIRNYQKSAIITSVFLILFFSFGHIHSIVYKWHIFGFMIGQRKYLFLINILFLSFLFFLIIRTKKNLNNFTKVFNIIGMFLVIFLMISIIYYSIKYLFHNKNYVSSSIINIEHIKNNRDIYYIILDGYGGNDILKEIYNYDNHIFTNFLLEKNFFIAFNSKSNYALTPLSLASSLNMEYINYITEYEKQDSRNWRIANQLIKNNKIINLLKSHGYEIIHIGSGVGATQNNKYADINIQSNKLSEFFIILIQTSMLKIIEQYIIVDNIRNGIKNMFVNLARISKRKGPKFVFAHIILPHPPYYFDENGQKPERSGIRFTGNVWKQKDNYINQLIFVNKKIMELIPIFISNSDIEPIIILQADHGPASEFEDPDMLDKNPNDLMIRERMSILNAYYLPMFSQKDVLYDSISPVNTFRLIFNIYFNMNYPLLKDKCYYSTYKNPYQFQEWKLKKHILDF